ncbi:undecaprenyl-diphosphate phosphatase [Thermococcus sp. Bubb.Bath]|uniref:undecaprenyl-diphosphate phosphatase n=1 Tax=Thermococcus sp. Bubb.Bath TaxID=1638242 RepID=UPI003183D972
MMRLIDYIPPIVHGAIGALASAFPASPETLVGKEYLVPSYVGFLFAILFYFRKEIGLLPTSELRKEPIREGRLFIYSLMFTVVMAYPVGRRLGWIVGDEKLDALNAAIGAVLLGLSLLLWRRGEGISKSIEKVVSGSDDGGALLHSVLVSVANAISIVGPSRGGLSVLFLALGEKNGEKVFRGSLIAGIGYYTVAVVLMDGWKFSGSAILPAIASASAFLVGLVAIHVIIYLGKLGWKGLAVYALIPVIIYAVEVVL